MSLPIHSRPAFEVGDQNRFAVRLEFVPNLDPGFASPEEDLSWGRLQLWSGGRNLCEHVDRSEVRKAIEWYLLPTIEWLADSWDFLLHEQRPPVSNSGDTAWQSLAETNRFERFSRPDSWDAEADRITTNWSSKHCLRTARFGGFYPDMVIRRWRNEVELSWGESPQAGTPQGFDFLHGTGVVRVQPDYVAEILHTLLDQVVNALLVEQPNSERLLALRENILRLKDTNRREKRTALLAGLGMNPEEHVTSWLKLRNNVEKQYSSFKKSITEWFEPSNENLLCVSGNCEAAVMFGAASPTLTEKDVFAIATYLVRSPRKKPSAKWSMLADNPQPLQVGESPWTDGYRLAKEWKGKADIRHNRDGSVDIEEHIDRLGVSVTDIELDDPTTAGLAVLPVEGIPQIFVNRTNPRCTFPSGKRFILAHELCHLLHDRAHGRNLAMISGPWAPQELEKRADAFAAALLMPPDLLHKGLEEEKVLEYDTLLAFAKRLRVSTNALAHHLENCGLITEENRDVLLDQLVNRQEIENGSKSGRRRKG